MKDRVAGEGELEKVVRGQRAEKVTVADKSVTYDEQVKEDKEKKKNLHLVLLSLIDLYLKPIDYDRWAKLHWKKQIEGNLTSNEEKELERLEKENLETIEEVYRALIKDKNIVGLIERIKNHEWVKVVEGNND